MKTHEEFSRENKRDIFVIKTLNSKKKMERESERDDKNKKKKFIVTYRQTSSQQF